MAPPTRFNESISMTNSSLELTLTLLASTPLFPSEPHTRVTAENFSFHALYKDQEEPLYRLSPFVGTDKFSVWLEPSLKIMFVPGIMFST